MSVTYRTSLPNSCRQTGVPSSEVYALGTEIGAIDIVCGQTLTGKWCLHRYIDHLPYEYTYPPNNTQLEDGPIRRKESLAASLLSINTTFRPDRFPAREIPLSVMRHANSMSISCDYCLMSRASHVTLSLQYTETLTGHQIRTELKCEYFLKEISWSSSFSSFEKVREFRPVFVAM